MRKISALKLVIGDKVNFHHYRNVLPVTITRIFLSPTKEEPEGNFPLFEIEDKIGIKQVYTYKLLEKLDERRNQTRN